MHLVGIFPLTLAMVVYITIIQILCAFSLFLTVLKAFEAESQKHVHLPELWTLLKACVIHTSFAPKFLKEGWTG